MRIVELPESWRGRAIVLTDAGDMPSRFSAGELAVIAGFKHEKRKREWMLSRIAEQELRKRGASGVCVSYSHSGAFGAAAVSESPAGIDVEITRTIPDGAVHLFLTAEEEAAARECSLENALLHFWSAKEARWKQLGGTVPTLKRVPLHLIDRTEHGLRFDVVETFATNGIVVALAAPSF
jgi:phosphopantetheinyl transferase